MLTGFDKAIASAVVSYLANLLLVRFNIHLPADVQVGLASLIVGLMVWVTPNVEAALQPKPPVVPPAAKALIIVAVLLSSLVCLPQARAATAQPPASVLQTLRDDAVAAAADAKTNSDVIAETCYNAIATVADAKLQSAQVTGGGVLLGFQKVRDFTRLNASPVGTNLILGCAPLVQDAKLNFVQFFTQIGGLVLLKGIIPLP